MTSAPLTAWADGWKRVLTAPALLASVFLLTLLAALPLALTLRGQIEAHLGPSLAAGNVAAGVDWDWWQEFRSQATGIATTFTPSVIGFAPVLDNIGGLLDGQGEVVPVTAALAAYLAIWLFLSGGLIDRYARQRRTRADGFFAACGVFFWRFMRLGVMAGTAYWLLFAYVRTELFDEWLVRLTRDTDVERAAFLWRVLFYAIFGALLIAVNVVADYAKVRLVVEDRRSAIGAVLAAVGFIVRNPARVSGLYALNSAAFVVLLLLWMAAAPGGATAVWVSVLLTQGYVLARLAMKLQFLASATALFQRRLAHAAYLAAPAYVRPDAPSVPPPPPAAPSAAS
jgi:hypothetical protein